MPPQKAVRYEDYCSNRPVLLVRIADDETLTILRAERLEVIARIGELAVANQAAAAILVAGVLYDVAYPSLEILLASFLRIGLRG
jgi:hypothetical protein